MTDRPPSLRDQIAEALYRWTTQQAAGGPARLLTRNETVLWENSLARADAVLAALTETAWIIPKIPHIRQPVGPWITPPRWIRRESGTSDPNHTRTYAAQLLAAADQAEQSTQPDTPPAVPTECPAWAWHACTCPHECNPEETP